MHRATQLNSRGVIPSSYPRLVHPRQSRRIRKSRMSARYSTSLMPPRAKRNTAGIRVPFGGMRKRVAWQHISALMQMLLHFRAHLSQTVQVAALRSVLNLGFEFGLGVDVIKRRAHHRPLVARRTRSHILFAETSLGNDAI